MTNLEPELRKEDHPLLTYDGDMTHYERMYFLRWSLGNENMSSDSFENLVIRLWKGENVDDVRVNPIAMKTVRFHVNKFKEFRGRNDYYDFVDVCYKKRYMKNFFRIVNRYCDHISGKSENDSDIIFPDVNM